MNNKINNRFVIEKNSSGGIIFSKSKGIYFQVDEVGLLILEGLISGKTVPELAVKIEREYAIDNTKACDDINVFIKKLQKIGY